MILPNIQKFVFDEERSMNFRNLVNQCAGSDNVIFCPHFGTIFSWWTPKTSPNSDSAFKTLVIGPSFSIARTSIGYTDRTGDVLYQFTDSTTAIDGATNGDVILCQLRAD